MRLGGVIAMLGAAALTAPAVAAAQVPAVPIPQEPTAQGPAFVGQPALAQPVASPDPPRHPFMAPNGRSNLHEDAYQTDVHQGSAPLGRDMTVRSTFLEGVCGSVTFDSRDRIVTVCVGLEGPKLVLLDPRTLGLLAAFPLPPRQPGTGSIFNDFAGGGYFYLDHLDRAVIPTTHRHLWLVEATDPPGFRLARDYDLAAAVKPPDKVMAAMPDWSGRLWFVSITGIVGTVDPASGTVRSIATGEEIANSFAVDESGGVYVVTKAALYRFDAAADGTPAVTWREVYDNSGIAKPGQVHAGSGTTPTVMGPEWVAIADNADPMNLVVYRRAAQVDGPRQVCKVPVLPQGMSATDQSLIATPTSLIVENNYGYTGPAATMDGRVTAPGLERVDVSTDGGCQKVWHSDEIAPTAVPKLGAATGLVYTYTKDTTQDDPWYLTALDYDTGQTVWKRLTGFGLGYNNNYAPITIGPDGAAYVGALGGLVTARDADGPAPAARRARPRPR